MTQNLCFALYILWNKFEDPILEWVKSRGLQCAESVKRMQGRILDAFITICNTTFCIARLETKTFNTEFNGNVTKFKRILNWKYQLWRTIILKLVKGNKTKIKFNQGLRQRCPILPVHFSFYLDWNIKESQERIEALNVNLLTIIICG